MSVRPELLNRLEFYCKDGIKKEVFDSLTNRHTWLKEYEASKLNSQIAVTMKDNAVARDSHMFGVQKLAGSALSPVGSIISLIYDNKDEDLDLESLLTHLCDTAKFLTEFVHK